MNDLADEGDGGGWGGGDLQGLAEHGFGLVEQGGVPGEEGSKGLAEGDAVAELGVHLDASVGADRRAGMGTARAEALYGPADLLAVHGGEEAGAG